MRLLIAMSWLVAFNVALASFNTALLSSQFVYQTMIPAEGLSCEQAAKDLGAKFNQATGARVTESLCQRSFAIIADGVTYQMYALAIRYSSVQAFYPYTAQIGGPDGSSYSAKSPTYLSYDDCLRDIPGQVGLFERMTRLLAVSSACEKANTYLNEYKLSIEGFDRKSNLQPAAKLYNFAPDTNNFINQQQKSDIASMISIQGGALARNEGNSFAYYRNYPVNIKTQQLAILEGHACELQIQYAENMLNSIGSKNYLVWCLPEAEAAAGSKDLYAIYDGIFRLQGDSGRSSLRYSDLTHCLESRDLVLSDSRNQNMVGGLCRKALFSSGDFFVLELFGKSSY